MVRDLASLASSWLVLGDFNVWVPAVDVSSLAADSRSEPLGLCAALGRGMRCLGV